MHREEFDGVEIPLDTDDRVVVAAVVEAALPDLINEVGVGKRKERERNAHDDQDQRPTNGEDSSNDVNTIVRRLLSTKSRCSIAEQPSPDAREPPVGRTSRSMV